MSAKKVELKTERLLLRPFRLEGVDDVDAYCSDKELARYVPLTECGRAMPTKNDSVDRTYWIGGATCAGKSTITGAVRSRCGLVSYHADDHWEKPVKRADAAAHPYLHRLGSMAPGRLVSTSSRRRDRRRTGWSASLSTPTTWPLGVWRRSTFRNEFFLNNCRNSLHCLPESGSLRSTGNKMSRRSPSFVIVIPRLLSTAATGSGPNAGEYIIVTRLGLLSPIFLLILLLIYLLTPGTT
jgi:hypothetical protein